MKAEASDDPVFTVRGDGLISTSGGLNVVEGGGSINGNLVLTLSSAAAAAVSAGVNSGVRASAPDFFLTGSACFAHYAQFAALRHPLCNA